MNDARDGCKNAAGHDPVASLRMHVAELKEYAKYLSDVRLAKLSQQGKKIALAVVLGAACAFLTAVAGAVSVILLMVGLARWIGTAMDRLWAGELMVGGGVLLLLTIAATVGAAKIRSSSRRKTILNFEGRKEKQRVQFGRSVERASEEEIGAAISGGGNGRGEKRHSTYAP